MRSAERKYQAVWWKWSIQRGAALRIWDMEYAIGPDAFNYKEMLPKLQELAGLARRVEVEQTFFDIATSSDVAEIWTKK